MSRSRRASQAAAATLHAAAAICCVIAPFHAATALAATHTVVIDGLKYEPETLTAKRGDTIVWVNKDPFPHTVTAEGAFDSHEIAAGKAWRYTARKPGQYPYVCTLHPTMKGTLKVE